MPTPPATHAIPPEGSLALLAAGHRALRAWREVRGTDWIDAIVELPPPKPKADATPEDATPEDGAQPPRDAKPTAARALPDAETLAGLRVVVVTGLPRSGTSMMMQMLEAGGLTPFTDEVRGADDSNPRGYYEHQAVKSLTRDATWLADADGRAVKVVAPLVASLPAGPRYVVVYMDRDLGQLVQSQTAMLARDGRLAADAEGLLASFARFRTASLRWADRSDRTDLLRVEHAEAIRDARSTAERVADFLEHHLDAAPLDRRAMAAVVDASLHRQRDAE